MYKPLFMFSNNNVFLEPVSEVPTNEISPSFAAFACIVFQKMCANLHVPETGPL